MINSHAVRHYEGGKRKFFSSHTCVNKKMKNEKNKTVLKASFVCVWWKIIFCINLKFFLAHLQMCGTRQVIGAWCSVRNRQFLHSILRWCWCIWTNREVLPGHSLSDQIAAYKKARTHIFSLRTAFERVSDNI